MADLSGRVGKGAIRAVPTVLFEVVGTLAFCSPYKLPIDFQTATHFRVVPANAGTHNHRRSRLRESRRTAPLTTRAAAYGSLRSQGRQRHTSAFPRRVRARVLIKTFRPRKQRAWGMPGAGCTRSLACENKKHTSVVTASSARFTRHSRTQWFNFPRNLTPASGRQDHTTSPSATQRSRQSAPRVHRISLPTFVTIAKRPFEWEETVKLIKLLLPNREANYFFKQGWTEQQVICPSGNRYRCSDDCARGKCRLNDTALHLASLNPGLARIPLRGSSGN